MFSYALHCQSSSSSAFIAQLSILVARHVGTSLPKQERAVGPVYAGSRDSHECAQSRWLPRRCGTCRTLFAARMTHAKIPFGEVVVKRHSQVREESQYGVLMFAQPIQEIATGMLFGSPSFSFRGEDAGMNPIALIEQRQETSVPVSDLGWGKPQAATCTCVIGGALHQEQQAFHFDRPP